MSVSIQDAICSYFVNNLRIWSFLQWYLPYRHLSCFHLHLWPYMYIEEGLVRAKLV